MAERPIVKTQLIPRGLGEVHTAHAVFLAHGFKIIAFGGFFRDWWLGLPSRDMNILVHAARPKEIDQKLGGALWPCTDQDSESADADTTWLGSEQVTFVRRCFLRGTMPLSIELIGISEMVSPEDVVREIDFGVNQIASGADGQIYRTEWFDKDMGARTVALRGRRTGDSLKRSESRAIDIAQRLGFGIDWDSFKSAVHTV